MVKVNRKGEAHMREWVCEERCGVTVTACINPVVCPGCQAELVGAPRGSAS